MEMDAIPLRMLGSVVAFTIELIMSSSKYLPLVLGPKTGIEPTLTSGALMSEFQRR